MNLVDNGIKIVVLKCPYNTYKESEEMRNMLSLVFQLKLEGYMKYYPYGILPISDIDFVGDHILMCRYENNVLIPVSGFKSIKNSVCEKFQLSFPIVQHKFGQQKEKFKNYVYGVDLWMNQLKQEGVDFAYNLSWTILPSLDRPTRNIVRELTFALMYFHYNHEGIKNVINSTAALRGINAQEERMEMEYLKDENGHALGAFESPTFYGQPFYIMHTKKTGFGSGFIEDCQKFRNLWESRLVIGDINQKSQKVAQKILYQLKIGSSHHLGVLIWLSESQHQ